MTYRTVFDAADAGSANWWFPGIGLALVLVGILLVATSPMVARLPFYRGFAPLHRGFAWMFLLFALCWTAIMGVLTYNRHRMVQDLLLTGAYAIVEGPVTGFIPAPIGGHKEESFAVKGRRFFYSDYVVTPGFHRTASHGGPIREGLMVRVSYSGEMILRLEVAE